MTCGAVFQSRAAPNKGCSKSLAEFRRRSGERKSRSFSPATCAAEKIPLGLQTCAPSAKADGACAAAGRNPFFKKGILFDSNDPAGSCPRWSGSACPKASQSFAAAAAKESQIIFSGDMCGGENTSQAASVEFVCRRRTNYARSRLQPLCQKVILFDSDNPAGDCLRGCLSTTLQAQRSAFLHWDAGELRLRQITPTALPSSRQTAS